MDKVAVLLSVYKNDNVNFLRKAVDSITMQTYKGFHIYIGVDGPVGDGISKYIKQIDVSDKISVVWFSQNRGLACVLNDLIFIAKKNGCEYFARMDADDVSLQDRFEKQVAFLDNNSDVDVVGGAIEEIDGEDILSGKRVVYPLTHNDCRKYFRYRDPLAHPTVMFRASFFDKISGGYRNDYRKNQDTMLWLDGFRCGCIFANLPYTILYYRVTDDFFKFRRNGLTRAKNMLEDRLKINKELNYDISANLFAMIMFFVTISPLWLKKLLYRIR